MLLFLTLLQVICCNFNKINTCNTYVTNVWKCYRHGLRNNELQSLVSKRVIGGYIINKKDELTLFRHMRRLLIGLKLERSPASFIHRINFTA